MVCNAFGIMRKGKQCCTKGGEEGAILKRWGEVIHQELPPSGVLMMIYLIDSG